MSELETIKRIAEEQGEMLAARDAKMPAVTIGSKTVEEFLRSSRTLCYGGTAINNLLPEEDRFYGADEAPDYDFFTETPQEHGVRLANKLHTAGLGSIELKPGVHLGTYKLFAEYHAVADLTFINPKIFENLWKDKMTRHGIHYVNPNFLRMAMYLELSRPEGDISRWEKVYTRLMLLNKEFPIVCSGRAKRPDELSPIRKKETIKMLKNSPIILLGFSAVSRHEKKAYWYTPVTLLAEKSEIEKHTKGKKTIEHDASELLPSRTDVLDENGEVLYQFYETQACHSYHVTADGIKIGSIPTILAFFLALIYLGESKDDITRLECVAQRLIELAGHKPERRFALLTPKPCLGKQNELVDLRRNRTDLFKKISNNKSSPDFIQYFFTYNPTASKTERKKVRDVLKKTQKARLTLED